MTNAQQLLLRDSLDAIEEVRNAMFRATWADNKDKTCAEYFGDLRKGTIGGDMAANLSSATNRINAALEIK